VTVTLLRPMSEADVADVLTLNEAEVHLLAPMDEDKLRRIHDLARAVDVIEVDGGFGGFVITVGAGAAYWSELYRWFDERYDDFVYLDRVVLHERVRRRGVGRAVYDQLEAQARRDLSARGATPRMTLEVNIDPPNEPSLAFHRGRGYVDVGRTGVTGHQVTMMVKDLTGPLG
jgi:uncharacterized protein